MATSIETPRYDALWFTHGAALLAGLFVPLHYILGSSATIALYIGFNALFNLPHQYCTWFRVATHPDGKRRAMWAATAATFFVLLSLAALAPAGYAALVFTNALPYWGIWHLIAQHFGISQIYRARGGEPPGSRRMARGFFITIFALGILRAHAATDLTFRVGDMGESMLRLPFPVEYGAAMTWALAAIYVVVCAVRLIPAARTNRERFEFEGYVALITFVAFFAVDDIMITTAVITSLHNIHYIGLVRSMVKERHGQQPEYRPLLRRDVLQAYIYSIGVHAVFLISALAGQVVLATLVAMHYFIDGQIWKLRGDHALARYLRLIPVGARAGGEGG